MKFRIILLAMLFAASSFTVVWGQDTRAGSQDIPAGLVRALEGIGQNILGAANFFMNPGPAEINPGPPTLNHWIDDTPNVPLRVNVFANPASPTTWLRLTIENGVVRILREQNTTIGNPDTRMDFTDLGAFAPPNPIHPPNPISERVDVPVGLVQALEGIGQNILGSANFFAQPGPPTTEVNPEPPNLNLWIDDTSNVSLRINVFQNPGPPTADANPGPATTWLRITIENAVVRIFREQNTTIGNPDTRMDFADLSGFIPPNPIQRQ